MPLISDLARQKKAQYFTQYIPASARVLEIGCADRWFERYLQESVGASYTGLDLAPPADIVGDVLRWRELGIAPGDYDVVVAFEVVEHVPCFEAVHEFLADGGLLMVRTPHPRMDWLCWCLEVSGLCQKRTSPHDHLVNLKQVPLFEPVEVRFIFPCAQWGIFRKTGG